jgi:hypothetical protein
MTPQSNRLKRGLLFIAMALSLLWFTAMAATGQEIAATAGLAGAQSVSSSSARVGSPGSEFVESRAAAPPTGPARRSPNTDTLSYWYGENYHTPFVLKPGTFQAANIQRNSLEFKHTDSWTLGYNFVDLILAKSNMSEPSSGGGDGATEAYITIRSGFGLNEISCTRAFQFGPVRNVALEVGANIQTKNSEFAPSERTLYFGPNFEMKMPKGYLKVGLHLRKEWVHEGTLGKVANYDPNFNFEPSWLIPFSIGNAHLTYSGFADYNTPKGKDTFGTNTSSEFLIRSAVGLDIGALILSRASPATAEDSSSFREKRRKLLNQTRKSR